MIFSHEKWIMCKLFKFHVTGNDRGEIKYIEKKYHRKVRDLHENNKSIWMKISTLIKVNWAVHGLKLESSWKVKGSVIETRK